MWKRASRSASLMSVITAQNLDHADMRSRRLARSSPRLYAPCTRGTVCASAFSAILPGKSVQSSTQDRCAARRHIVRSWGSHDVGSKVMVQVTTVAQAIEAAERGADRRNYSAGRRGRWLRLRRQYDGPRPPLVASHTENPTYLRSRFASGFSPEIFSGEAYLKQLISVWSGV